ncbi:MAG: uroporphyrinogen decarboxylase [Acidimicrobiales bacterium]|nr:uroporphyrinogen decarboxylase [Acidimicrobiales bacterium]
MNGPEASPFLAACRGERPSRRPLWFMRQAGRSLPEYRAIRGTGSILQAVKDPALAAEITLQPIRRYGTDAAILYSDIMVPIAAVGFGVDIKAGVGPVAEVPFRTRADLDRVRPLDAEGDTPYVAETVRLLVRELQVPLIGFAGAPFTVASYLIEGGPSRTYTRTKAMMLGDPQLFADLLARLADHAITSLRAQVAAGARAVQVFDSWAGALHPAHYERHVLPHSRAVFDAVAELGVPRIHFGVTTGELLGLMASAGADVVGVDWLVPLDAARARVPAGTALQGNLDPAVILAGWDATRAEAADVLARNGDHVGHIFNLGHGVLPESDPDVLARLAEFVHAQPVPEAGP